MNNYRLKILEMDCKLNVLHIEVSVQGKFISTVREPKVAVIFSNGRQIRRLPLLVTKYFPDETQLGFRIFAKYTYELEYLFYKEPYNKEIKFWFEFIYGEDCEERIPFTVSEDIRNEDFDDCEVESCGNDNSILIRSLLKEDIPSLPKKILKGFSNVIKLVWDIVLCIIAVVMIPLFFIESILVKLNCASQAPIEKKSGLIYIPYHITWRLNRFTNKRFGFIYLNIGIANIFYQFFSLSKVKQNRIVFFSNRRNDLTGNFEYVYEKIKNDTALDICFVLDESNIRTMSLKNAVKYGIYCATSKVILVDDYVNLLFRLPRRKGTTMIQLWHACGAFKTFGYSRLGRKGGTKQNSLGHRINDYAIVSSQKIAKFYAEGFGMSLEKIIATGIPRTDIFFDQEYKENIRKEFYKKYPKLFDKKILLFAPTFRGDTKSTGYYPVDKFDIVKLYEELNGEYAVLIKHHPFVSDRNVIPPKYKDVIMDLSKNSELNDFLFVADLLVTDYSSVIFEAALLNLPMLFFSYDLHQYTATRGFYYDYESFVPGKIVFRLNQVIKAIKNEDFETDKIESFKTKFFDHLDGKSSERVTNLIYDIIGKK